MPIARVPAATQDEHGDAGRAEVDAASNGTDLDDRQQRSALDYLLGTPKAATYKVLVQYETDGGIKELEFHFRALDGRKIDKIEQAAINERTGLMDKITADSQLVAEATDAIVDPESGAKVSVRDEKFLIIRPGDAPLAAPPDALLARFGTQIGLLAGVASAIREAAGWNRERVGKASRVLVDAAGN